MGDPLRDPMSSMSHHAQSEEKHVQPCVTCNCDSKRAFIWWRKCLCRDVKLQICSATCPYHPPASKQIGVNDCERQHTKHLPSMGETRMKNIKVVNCANLRTVCCDRGRSFHPKQLLKLRPGDQVTPGQESLKIPQCFRDLILFPNMFHSFSSHSYMHRCTGGWYIQLF